MGATVASAETLVPESTMGGEGGAGGALADLHLPEVTPKRYDDEGSLGMGGMGEVRLCLDHTIGRQVAMKVARAGLDHRPDVRTRFLLEARVQGQLEHPAILPVYDLGRGTDGAPYFTMRRVRGRTLEQLLTALESGTDDLRERFNERRLLSDFSQLCLALDFVHARGVVHRDLKPANIMFGEYGEVYLFDWGLAKVLGEPDDAPREGVGKGTRLEDSGPNTHCDVILGTPGYLAPELVRAHDQVDGPADVYSLGAVLFEMLTGEPLHKGKRTIDLLNSTARGAEKRIQSPNFPLPPEVQELVLAATAQEPEDRPTARALHEGIERYLDGHRDSERRRHLADALTAEVSVAAATETEEARRDALAKLGRALALDPTHGPAIERLVELLTDPPATLPDEVREELAEQETRQTRHAGRLGAGVFLGLNLFVPLAIWTGVRDWVPFAVFAALTTTTGIVSWLVSRLEHPGTIQALSVYVFALATATSTSVLFGPYLVAPIFILVVTLLFSLNHPPQYRVLFVTLGALAAIVPMGLEWAGVVGPSVEFGADGMRFLPRISELRPIPTLAILATASVGAILIAGGAMGPIRRELDRAQARLHVQAWQLRQVVPTSGADGVKDGVGGAEGTGADDPRPGEPGQ